MAGVHDLCLSVSVLLGSEVKVLGRQDWFVEVKSHAWTLAVAGPRGRFTRVSGELLDPLSGGRHRSFTVAAWTCYLRKQRPLLGSGKEVGCTGGAPQSREWEVNGNWAQEPCELVLHAGLVLFKC